MSRTAALLIALALLGAACGGTDATTTTVAEVPLEIVPRTYEEFRAQDTACSAEAPEAVEEMSFAAPDDLGLESPVTVVIETSCGSIEAVLDPAQAPDTVNSFVFLAEQGYFDGTVWHRVFPGFMIQGGDPTATGTGGPGYAITDEFPAEGFSYTRGTLAMANAGPGTTGSQFFIMLADGALPPEYSVFGEVTSGDETLDAIAAVPLGTAIGRPDPVPTTPLETVYIESVTVR